jgi:hypothetical protein
MLRDSRDEVLIAGSAIGHQDDGRLFIEQVVGFGHPPIDLDGGNPADPLAFGDTIFPDGQTCHVAASDAPLQDVVEVGDHTVVLHLPLPKAALVNLNYCSERILAPVNDELLTPPGIQRAHRTSGLIVPVRRAMQTTIDEFRPVWPACVGAGCKTEPDRYSKH